jgi:hypothetical protein
MKSTGSQWAEFAAAMPDMAAAGLALLYQPDGTGLGYLATVRADGAPRLHPVCPHVAADQLWVFIGRRSPKRLDLLRDGRYALHTFPAKGKDDEFSVAGTAEQCDDAALIANVRATLPFNSEGDDQPFVLTIDRALLAVYPGPPPAWPPEYTRWRAPVPSA